MAVNLAQEGQYDFSVSRAYYAMFYAVQALLLERGLTFSSHGAVISAYGREFAKTGELEAKYHRWLIQAHEVRNQGDYSMLVMVTGPEAQSTAQHAEEFLAAVEAHLKRS